MTPAASIAEAMPDIIKLTVVGIALDPPTIDPAAVEPNMAIALDHLERIGVAVAAARGSRRTYFLTRLGREVFAIVERQTPRDGTLPANDTDDLPPEAA